MMIKKSEEKVLFNNKTKAEHKSYLLARKEITRDKDFLAWQKEMNRVKEKQLRELKKLENKNDELRGEIMKKELRIKVIEDTPERHNSSASVNHLNRILSSLEERPLGKNEIRKELMLENCSSSAISFLLKHKMIRYNGTKYELIKS